MDAFACAESWIDPVLDSVEIPLIKANKSASSSNSIIERGFMMEDGGKESEGTEGEKEMSTASFWFWEVDDKSNNADIVQISWKSLMIR